MRFLSGRTDAGDGYVVSDPLAGRLLRVEQSCGQDAAALVDELFAVTDIFVPEMATHAAFKAAVSEHLRAIRASGMRQALAGFLRR
jgi:mannitol-1-phosphate/altronate dehydrogenase